MKPNILVFPAFLLLASSLLLSCGDSSSSDPAVLSEPDATPTSLTDTRDGKIYGITKIGTRIWMSQNLNYVVDSSWCYGNDPRNCTEHGRLYTFQSALDGDSAGTDDYMTAQGVCPSGWHIPSFDEWMDLVNFVERDPRVGSYGGGQGLRSATGWKIEDPDLVGTDVFGFHADPTGYGGGDEYYSRIDTIGYWWTCSQISPTYAASIPLSSYSSLVDWESSGKSDRYAIRCIKDTVR